MAKNRSGASGDAAASRLSLIEQGIVFFQENEITTPESIDALFDRLPELTRGEPFAIVVDLHRATRPDSMTRSRIRQRVIAETNLRRIAVVTGENSLINVVAKFLMARLGKPLSVHRTAEQALRELRG